VITVLEGRFLVEVGRVSSLVFLRVRNSPADPPGCQLGLHAEGLSFACVRGMMWP
jgi:hypothetical protein